MASMLPNEGENMIANLLFAGSSVDRGTGMELGLFTNASITETITAVTLTEPTGGSYARKALANGSWTITGDTASYAMQTFTASGSAMTGSIYGYFVCTTGGTTKRIVDIVVDPNGPYTLLQNDTYDITLNITIA